MNKKIVIIFLLIVLIPSVYAYSASEFLSDFRIIFTGFAAQGFNGDEDPPAPFPGPEVPIDDPIEKIGGETCEEYWVCTSWSECINNQRTRTCTDQNQCGTEENIPLEISSCEIGQCGDGTATGQCSLNQPFYCNNGNLIENCALCGCPSEHTCEGYSCIENIDGEETEDQRILNIPPIVQQINEVNVLIGESFSIEVLSTDFEGDTITHSFINQNDIYSNEYITCNMNQNIISCSTKEQGKTPGEIFADHMPDIFGGEDSDFEI